MFPRLYAQAFKKSIEAFIAIPLYTVKEFDSPGNQT